MFVEAGISSDLESDCIIEYWGYGKVVGSNRD